MIQYVVSIFSDINTSQGSDAFKEW